MHQQLYASRLPSSHGPPLERRTHVDDRVVHSTLMNAADCAVAAHSTVRRCVLSFLPLRSLHRAARISEPWFEAARDPGVFETAIEKHFARRRVPQSSSASSAANATTLPMLSAWYPQIHMPLLFSHPGIFKLVLQASVQYHDSIKGLLGSEDDTFFHYCGCMFGSLSNRFEFQFPVLLFMLHASSNAFLATKPDPMTREEYVEKRRFLLLIANAVRWHESYPSQGHVPWLVELYRWAAHYAPLPFDQIMLMPLLTLVQQHATGATVLQERTVLELVDETRVFMQRILPVDQFLPAMVAHRAATGGGGAAEGSAAPRPSPSPPRPPASQGSAFEIEREIFRAVVVLLEQFRVSMPSVKEALAAAMQPYGSLGIEELIQFRARADVFRVMKFVVLKERDALRKREEEER